VPSTSAERCSSSTISHVAAKRARRSSRARRSPASGSVSRRKSSGARRQTISPIWARALGSASPTRRYAVAFAAGFIMLFGARLADGCTSGHGLSGTAQLAVGSMVAVAAMFAGGIATALALLRRT